MLSNVGTKDRIIRILMALVLLSLGLGLYAGTTVGTILTFVALIPALTGLFGFCGLYKLLGINTCKSMNS